MQAATIAMIPTAAPLQNPAATSQASPASGQPVFAQMVAQKVAATNSQQADVPAANNPQTAAPSSATANSPANSSGNKTAAKSTNAPGRTRGNALLDLLALQIPGLSTILPQPPVDAITPPALSTAAIGTCGAWAVAGQPDVGTTPASIKISDAPDAPLSSATNSGMPMGSVAPVQIDQNSSAVGNSQAATIAGANLGPVASTPGGTNAIGAPLTAPQTTSVTQDIAANQLPAMTSNPQPSVTPSLDDGAGNTPSFATVPGSQDVAAQQTPEFSWNPPSPAPMSQATPAGDATVSASTPAVQDVAVNQTPPPALDPQAPATPSQGAPASKAASSVPVTSHAKATTAQPANNSVAGNQPQLPTLGDVLRQVAAVTGKANAQAAQIDSNTARDSLNGPMKSTPIDLSDAAKTVLQPPGLRSAAVGSQQASIDASNTPTANGAGSGSTTDQNEQGSAAAPLPDSKASNATPSVNFSGVLSTAHQNSTDPSANLPGSVTTSVTIPVAKNDTPGQKSASPDPSRNDGVTNPALEKPDLDANTSRVISSAQLSGNNTHSEMHIAMQTDKLGAVELHAQVTGEQVGAAITVEKKEAHAALAVELPALQQALSEKNLSVAHVVLLQGALHSTADGAGDSTPQQQRSQPGMTYGQQQEEAPLPPIFAAAQEPNGIFDDRGRLSVHA